MSSRSERLALCPKHAHLYLDVLHLLARACQHQKADLDQVRAWHDEVKTLFPTRTDEKDFIFDEDFERDFN